MQEKINSLPDLTVHTDMETLEAVLLIANGYDDLLRKRLIELEDF